MRIGSLRQDLRHRKHNFEDRFSRHLSASILFLCASANGAVNGIGRGFSAVSGRAERAIGRRERRTAKAWRIYAYTDYILILY